MSDEAHAMITLGESCPRCGALLRASIRRADAEQGFFCPACDGALLWIDDGTARRRAFVILALSLLGGVGLGGVGALLVFMLTIGGGLFWYALATLAGAAVAAITGHVLWRVLRALVGLQRGRRLLAAQKTKLGWYVPGPIHEPPTLRRRRLHLDPDTLHGALSEASTLDSAATRGALSAPDDR